MKQKDALDVKNSKPSTNSKSMEDITKYQATKEDALYVSNVNEQEYCLNYGLHDMTSSNDNL
jgi:hypothetical protein